MGGELQKQLFGQPKALAVAASILGILGVIPGMPNIAFLSIGAICGFAAWRLVKKREAEAAAPVVAPEPPPPPPSPENQELSWEDVRPVDAVGLEVGYRLVPLVIARRAATCSRASVAFAANSRRSSASSCRPCTSATTWSWVPTPTASGWPGSPSAKVWCIRIANSPSTPAACSGR
jgi:hypothetical protein